MIIRIMCVRVCLCVCFIFTLKRHVDISIEYTYSSHRKHTYNYTFHMYRTYLQNTLSKSIYTVNILIRSNVTNCITSIAHIQSTCNALFKQIYPDSVLSCRSQTFVSVFILSITANWAWAVTIWHLPSTFTLNIH